MDRTNQFILIGSFLPFCWLAFMAVHESGHVIGGLLCGGTIEKVVVHPLTISRTDVNPDPNPLLTVWSGPVIGVAIPLALFMLFVSLNLKAAFLTRFFAGFCLVANGLYIGEGWIQKVGDAGVMLENGSPIWSLCVFGGLSIASGLFLWHGQGPNFGLGRANEKVDENAAYLSLGLCAILFVVASIFSPMS